ncbi:uncharacterized protein [Montipora capricornis]|uniref:uncharacterized protein n=1 Tax=Montipora capricornis TaxID=246305 RepID=UPI0035F11C19
MAAAALETNKTRQNPEKHISPKRDIAIASLDELYEEFNMLYQVEPELIALENEIARYLPEKESLKLDRARQHRIEQQQKEEEEDKMLSEPLSKLKENGKNRVNHCEVAEIQTAPVPVGSRDRPVHTDNAKPHQKLSAKGSNSSRGSDNGNSIGEGTVVQLPRPAEGGRLECDRIIMADGTAIDLFDENDDSGVREKAHRRSRERQDEVGNSDQ